MLTYEIVSDSQLYPRKEQKMKRKTPGEQQQPDFPAPRLDARFEFNLENVCISAAKLGAGNNGAQQ